jgi:hypothetical protein
MEWDYVTTQLVLEMLAHRTPPSCIVPNIVTAAELLLPGHSIIQQLPGLPFVRRSCTILLHVTKTLAAYEIARAE